MATATKAKPAQPATTAITIPDPAPLQREEAPLIQRSTALAVVDARSYETGAIILRDCRDLKKKVCDMFNPLAAQANALHKSITGARANLLDPLEQVERITEGKLSSWQQAEHRKQRSEQERQEKIAREADEKRRAEEAAALQAQAKAERDKNEKARLLQEAKAVKSDPTPPYVPPVASSVPRVQGMASTTVVDYEITDPDLVPREFCVPSPEKIRAAVRGYANAANCKIPGVRAFERTQFSRR